MKLRLKHNSVRMRLSQSDVRTFCELGTVEESIVFGGPAGSRLTYRLVADNATESLTAVIEENLITLTVPGSLAGEWVSTSRVGMQADQPQGENEFLSILVEKDFACLETRGNGDDDDAFPNPLICGSPEAAA